MAAGKAVWVRGAAPHERSFFSRGGQAGGKRISMRLNLSVWNARRTELGPVDVDAVVDPDAVHLCLTPKLALKLGLQTLDTRHVRDGWRTIEARYAGPVRLAYRNVTCFCGALVFGTETRLGLVPMGSLRIDKHGNPII